MICQPDLMLFTRHTVELVPPGALKSPHFVLMLILIFAVTPNQLQQV